MDEAWVQEWESRYGGDQVWSGDPNGALVAEAADLPPGRVLDVGSGEGGDAVWLARRGWAVTGLDVARSALDRGAAAARAAGVEVAWVLSGLVGAPLEPASFDLVSACYPALHRTPGRDAERALRDLVAPGGTLLVVSHADMHTPEARERARAHGFDPADFVETGDVRAVLDDAAWDVQVDERRPRVVPATGGGTGHRDDLVLRARRRA